MTLSRAPLAAEPVDGLLCRLGPLQGSGGRAPGPPQGTPPLAERVEHVESPTELGQAGGATTGVVEPHALTQAGAVVADHGL